MQVRVLPGRRAVAALAAIAGALLIALAAGLPVAVGTSIAIAAIAGVLLAAAADYAASRRAWLAASPRLTRRLPAAFAVGVRRPVQLAIEIGGDRPWSGALFDFTDPTLAIDGLPARLALQPGTRLDVTYAVVPTRRGTVTFEPAELRIASRWGLCELRERLGTPESRRVFPDFAQVARYAWLAGDRRLPEMGIKTYQRRGEGTDFKQLSEYRIGDPVRHLDWRATLRVGKPIVREFQDERDQCVMLLIDCGRRLRADDRTGALGASHFDQVLNAVMLLAHVALQQGDAVGALTFGTPPGEARSIPPHKGGRALSALMGELYGVQPSPTHSDYVAAAQDLLRRQSKRALVVIITNFRDEDGAELRQALQLLRSRHLVLLASLRERIVGELIAQPLTRGEAPIEVASAQLYEQSRRDAFNRLATREALMVDAEPDRLAVELVNRYHAVKRAGLI